MKRFLVALAFVPVMAQAQTAAIVDEHILPGFATLAETSTTLSDAAAADCAPASAPLREAYHAAFDAWVAVSHLRFGPTETDDRAFALAFWPDSRGATPKTLGSLIRDEDPIADDPAAYTDVSIAARGFYALEFLLFDPAMSAQGSDAYRCQLTQTIAADIAAMADAIFVEWSTDYATRLVTPSDPYQSKAEALQELFKALNTGVEFASDARLGRPLGTFDKPRPTRAEAWRSDRSSRNTAVAVASLRALAGHLSDDPDLIALFDRAVAQLAALDDPRFAGVEEPQARLRIEAVRSTVEEIRGYLATELGPKLGVDIGFNALDGD